VGLPFIPPELREACGEIDAAERGKLPQLVTLEELRGDLHCHTDASDGLGSARQMAEAAMAEGLEYLAITDHSKSLTVARGLDEVRVRVQLKHLRRLQDRLNGLQLLAGIEVDILPNGDLDLDPLLLRDLDWVVASVHSEMDMPASEMSSRLIRAMETGVVDCLGHPTGRRLAIREGYPLDLQRLLRAAADLDVAFELNANPGRLDLDSVACRQARDMGVWVAINSDAHSPTELQRRDIGVFVARRGWLEARHVLNAQPLRLLEDRRRARMRRSETLVAVAEQVCRGDEQRDSESVQRSRVAPGLRDQLERGAPDSDLRHRLEAYLKGASDDDPALAETLACLSDNPLQLAFDLLASSRGASEDEEWHDE